MQDIKQCIIDNSINPCIYKIDRYLKFIDYCRTIEFSGYTENHHILPSSFGGGNEVENLIRIGARYHYIAHLLLAKATNSHKMIKALHKMIYSRTGDVCRQYVVSSKVYAYVREEHAKIVSGYSKNTVVAKYIVTGEIKRVPRDLFHMYNGILYSAISKGREDTPETKLKKQIASKRSRIVRQGMRSRSIAASIYSYNTPKGFCENKQDVFNLYPTFTEETLNVVVRDSIISKKIYINTSGIYTTSWV